jgi:hypothetical protein
VSAALTLPTCSFAGSEEPSDAPAQAVSITTIAAPRTPLLVIIVGVV